VKPKLKEKIIYASGSRNSSGSFAKNGNDALRLVAWEQFAPETPTRLLFEIPHSRVTRINYFVHSQRGGMRVKQAVP
jgi:hypothetical protein